MILLKPQTFFPFPQKHTSTLPIRNVWSLIIVYEKKKKGTFGMEAASFPLKVRHFQVCMIYVPKHARKDRR